MQVVSALKNWLYTSKTMAFLFSPYANRLKTAARNERNYYKTPSSCTTSLTKNGGFEIIHIFQRKSKLTVTRVCVIV